MKLGIIGATGHMGLAITKSISNNKSFSHSDIMLSNASGNFSVLSEFPNLKSTTDNNVLLDFSDVIILACRPSDVSQLNLDFENKLIISVLAGATIESLIQALSSDHIVRAMPNLAAEFQVSFTPYLLSDNCNDSDKEIAERILNAIGESHCVSTEEEFNKITAISGAGPGYFAFILDQFIEASIEQGIDRETAKKACIQTFYGCGELFKHGCDSPAEVVTNMTRYKGVTAMGVEQLRLIPIKDIFSKVIQAAFKKANSNMQR